MRRLISPLLVLTIILAGSYYYHTASAVCDAPIAYRIGTLDPEFGLSYDEARTAIADAESLWEDTTGRNLFTYRDDARFTINFIFDARQQRTNEEQKLSEVLEKQKNMSEKVKAEYNALTEKYEALTASYEVQKNAYERKLNAYNQEVEKWNREGGAPQGVYDDLARRQGELAKEQGTLNEVAHQLNQIVRDINELSEEGNVVVSAYNSVVGLYNKTFGSKREFTQGDYRGDLINIYQYSDGDELRLVLSHEMGHALSLDHVEGEHSIMHYLMGGQTFEGGLSQTDKEEFLQVCGEG